MLDSGDMNYLNYIVLVETSIIFRHTWVDICNLICFVHIPYGLFEVVIFHKSHVRDTLGRGNQLINATGIYPGYRSSIYALVYVQEHGMFSSAVNSGTLVTPTYSTRYHVNTEGHQNRRSPNVSLYWPLSIFVIFYWYCQLIILVVWFHAYIGTVL